jgi:hypothetical protein
MNAVVVRLVTTKPLKTPANYIVIVYIPTNTFIYL